MKLRGFVDYSSWLHLGWWVEVSEFGFRVGLDFRFELGVCDDFFYECEEESILEFLLEAHVVKWCGGSAYLSDLSL